MMLKKGRKMLKNLTRKSTLAEKTRFLDSTLAHSTGLMLHSRIGGEAWIFRFRGKKKNSIHMFLVFFAIDILFLDEKNRVIEIASNLKPFRLYRPKEEYRTFVELAAGAKKNTRVGDRLSF